MTPWIIAADWTLAGSHSTGGTFGRTGAWPKTWMSVMGVLRNLRRFSSSNSDQSIDSSSKKSEKALPLSLLLENISIASLHSGDF